MLTAYFPPDVGSAAHLFYDLGRVFVERGHRVTVVTGLPSYHAQGNLSRYQGQRRMTEEMGGMSIMRTRVPEIARNTPLGRGLWQFSCAAVFGLASMKAPRADVSIVYSPPLPLALAAQALRRQKGVPFVVNVQDLFPQSAIDLGILRNNGLIRMFEALERHVYRRADAVTVHSEGNRNHVLARGAREATTRVLENTVDTDEIRPGPRMNDLRKELGIGERFVASFGGIMGYSQDLDVILEAARLLDGRSSMIFVLAGDGLEKERLVQKSRDLSLGNVRWLPMLPRERYPRLLEASDVCLTTLHANVKTPVVPSKILSAMAAGRPVIASLDGSGDAPKLIARAKAGYALPPEDPAALASTLSSLADQPETCTRLGENGRAFAEEHLSPRGMVKEYERLFAQIMAPGSRALEHEAAQ